jgi:hypothetical protein
VIHDALNIWLNVATVLCLVGVVVFFTILPSTTWFGDD